MTKITKAECLNILDDCFHSVFFALVAGSALIAIPIGQLPQEIIWNFESIRSHFSFHLPYTADDFHRAFCEDMHIRKSCLGRVCRSAITEAYESLQQLPQFETVITKQSWYNFLWILRNAFDHDFNLDIRDEKRKNRLPISWRSYTITESDLGSKAPITNIGVLELIKEVIDTVRNVIND